MGIKDERIRAMVAKMSNEACWKPFLAAALSKWSAWAMR